MNIKNINRVIDKIRQDAKLKTREKLIVCLNRSCDSMLEDAFLLTAEGEREEVFCQVHDGCDTADEAAVQLVEDGPDVVAFHESRPSSRDGRPNGIRVHHEDLYFPCVVFCNSGKERLTVDGEWVEPGSYVAVQEKGLNDPEAQKALDEFIRSPEVQEEIEEVRREVVKKGGRT